MRVLLTVHQFLPKYSFGTERVTFDIGRELLSRGHEVHVLTTDTASPSLPHKKVWDYDYRGLKVRVIGLNMQATPDPLRCVAVGLPGWGCLLLAVVGPTAGRYYIDITSGVPPKQFIRGEWFVAIAALTGLVWILLTWAGVGPWWAAGISFVVGFAVRVIALYRAWEEPLAKEPAGVYQHSDGRPMLGRKLAGKSEREMRNLGLDVENGQTTQRQ